MNGDGVTGLTGLSTGPLSAALRRWRWLAMGLLIGMILGGTAAAVRAPQYEATARLLFTGVDRAGVFGTTDGDAMRRLATQLELLRDDALLADAARAVDPPLSPDELRDRLDVRLSEVSDVVAVSVVDSDPRQAALLADAVAAALQDAMANSTATRVDSIRQELGALQARLEERAATAQSELESLPDGADGSAIEARRDLALSELHAVTMTVEEAVADAAIEAASLSELQAASVPDAPSTPGPLLGALVGGLLGLLVSGLVAWWWSERHPEVRGPRDVEHLLGIPLVGSAPARSTNGDRLRSSPGARATFRSFAARGGTDTAHRVLCSSAGPSDGAANAALQLALAGTALGERIALVDLDARHGSVTELTLGPDGHRQGTPIPGGAGVFRTLSVPEGRLTLVSMLPDERLTPKHLRARIVEVLDGLVEAGHLVLIHVPSLDDDRVAGAIVDLVDEVVLLVADHTPVADLVDGVRLLRRTAADLSGYIWLAPSRHDHTEGATHIPATRVAKATRRELDFA